MNENLNEYDVDDRMENYQPESDRRPEKERKKFLLACKNCGAEFTASTKYAQNCPACRKIVASRTMRINQMIACERGAYKRRMRRKTSKVEAECPACHKVHLVPAASVNPKNKKHWVYCPLHQRLRDVAEDAKYGVHL